LFTQAGNYSSNIDPLAISNRTLYVTDAEGKISFDGAQFAVEGISGKLYQGMFMCNGFPKISATSTLVKSSITQIQLLSEPETIMLIKDPRYSSYHFLFTIEVLNSENKGVCGKAPDIARILKQSDTTG
jgi:hypothetical protein